MDEEAAVEGVEGEAEDDDSDDQNRRDAFMSPPGIKSTPPLW